MTPCCPDVIVATNKNTDKNYMQISVSKNKLEDKMYL